MKKLICLVLVFAFMLSAGAMAESMLVHISAVNWDTNYVGKEWVGTFSIGGTKICDGDVVELGMGKYDLYTEIADMDSKPDVGSEQKTVNITENRLIKGFSVDQVITVAENQGFYSGYWTEWYVTYTFIPVTGAWVLDCRY